jgi:Aspartyl protease
MVPFFRKLSSLLGVLPMAACLATSAPFRAGFHLPDSVTELTLKYKTVNNLILLPVRINDTLEVNLILDTGTRNIVLFGKRFQKYFRFEPNKLIQFSGLGSGKSVSGKLSIHNQVSVQSIEGLDIPIVVVPEQNLFARFLNVHGVIGYEIFLKFEVEINPSTREITFRPPEKTKLDKQFTSLPLRIVDSRPILDCTINSSDGASQIGDLMIDTGSVFGLLLKNSKSDFAQSAAKTKTLGRGLNGDIEGIEVLTKELLLPGLEMKSVQTSIILSPWPSTASIGMGLLQEYSMVLNYCRGFMALRKATQ